MFILKLSEIFYFILFILLYFFISLNDIRNIDKTFELLHSLFLLS